MSIITLLFTSARNGHFDVIKFLAENGANIFAHTTMKFYFVSAEEGHLETVKYLIEN